MRTQALMPGLALLCAVLVVVSAAIGETFDLAGLWRAVLDVASLERAILLELRVPRTLLGVLVGASLGLAGAVMQGFLRNPLAEPGILGVSGCAAVGAVIVFYFGLASAWPLALPLGGVLGAAVAVVLLYGLAGRNASTQTLILAGVAINALAGALVALALNLTPNPFAAFEIVFWQMGSLADRSLQHVYLAGPLVLAGSLLLAMTGRGLDALALGETTARSLGTDVDRLRLVVVVGCALSVGAGVAVSGVIGFVGLVVPHLLRPLVGYEPGRLLFPSALAGAALLLGADLVVRILPTQNELKLGVVTALVGAPFFLLLLNRLRRGTL